MTEKIINVHMFIRNAVQIKNLDSSLLITMNQFSQSYMKYLEIIFPSSVIFVVFSFQLHIAAANGYVEVLEFLLDNDADTEVVDKDGWKPIHAAACWGNVSVVKELFNFLDVMAAVFCSKKLTEISFLGMRKMSFFRTPKVKFIESSCCTKIHLSLLFLVQSALLGWFGD